MESFRYDRVPTGLAEQSPGGSERDGDAARPSKYRRLNEQGRQRAVRACDGCRRVKEKCEGGVPCKRCAHLKRPCQFTHAVARNTETTTAEDRRTSHEPTVSSLLERCECLERLVRFHHPGLELDIANLRRTITSLETLEASDTNRLQHSTPAAEDEEDELSIDQEKCTVDPVDENVAHYSGEFSHWNFSMRVKRHFDDLETTEAFPAIESPERVPDYWRVERLQSNASGIAEIVRSLPPRPIADFLLHVFFSHASSDYYFVERRWLEAKVDFAYRDPDSLSAKDAGALAIILTVFAVGCQYAHLESSQSADSQQRTSDRWEPELGNMFYNQSVRLLPELIHLGSLESVQACSLLALYSLPIDASGLGYIYVNLAIKLGVQNGMHRKPPGKSFSASTVEIRNRTWWTAYCLEKTVGIFHGRPVSLAASEVDADLPSDFPGLQTAERSPDISQFRILIHLIRRLEGFLADIALLRNGDKSQTSRILSQLVSGRDSLTAWWETLALTERTQQKPSRTTDPRATMHVRLVYCLVRMFVGRPCLLSRPRRQPAVFSGSPARGLDDQNDPTTPQSRAESAASTRDTNASKLIQDCTDAAKEAIEICQALHSSATGLAYASYLEYSSCRAALLVLIAFCIENRTDEPHSVLQTGLHLIREMTATGESARSEVMLIESLERALKRLLSLNKASGRRANADTSSAAKVGYEQFQRWGSLWRTGGTAPDTSFTSNPTPDQNLRLGIPDDGQQNIGDMSWMSVHAQDASPSDSRNFDCLQMAARSAFFDFENLDTAGVIGGGQYHPERQMLENFLSMPDYGFTPGFTQGSYGSTPHSAHLPKNT